MRERKKEKKKSRKKKREEKESTVKLPRGKTVISTKKEGKSEKKKRKKEMGLGPIYLDTQGPNAPIAFYSQAQSNLGSQKSKVQFIWTPEESKAQLKWAPATSKDGSDYDPPSPVTYS
jgi:hypothetical protein